MSDQHTSDTDHDVLYPEIRAYDKKTCPECGVESSHMEHYPDLLPFDDGYIPDTDQSETYYGCDDCGTEWRYVDADTKQSEGNE